jgi:hypothetical protein
MGLKELESEMVFDGRFVKMTPIGITYLQETRSFDEWITYCEENIAKNIQKNTFIRFEYLIRRYYPKYFDNQSTLHYLIKNQTPNDQMQLRSKIIEIYGLMKRIETSYESESKLKHTFQTNEQKIKDLQLQMDILNAEQKLIQLRMNDLKEESIQYQELRSKIDKDSLNIADFQLLLFNIVDYHSDNLSHYVRVIGKSKNLLVIEGTFDKDQKELMMDHKWNLKYILNLNNDEIPIINEVQELKFNIYEISYSIKKKIKK